MTVYTIHFTVETEPERLAEAIMKRFSDVIVGYKTDGPFEVERIGELE